MEKKIMEGNAKIVELVVIRKGTKIVWSTLANSDDTKVLKQHAFKSIKRGEFWQEKYDGNISLCGKIGAYDGSKFIPLNEIESERLNEKNCCQSCLNIYNNIVSKEQTT